MTLAQTIGGTGSVIAVAPIASSSPALAQDNENKTPRSKNGDAEHVAGYKPEKGENLGCQIKALLTGNSGDA